jgi:hypothetical protein
MVETYNNLEKEPIWVVKEPHLAKTKDGIKFFPTFKLTNGRTRFSGYASDKIISKWEKINATN